MTPNPESPVTKTVDSPLCDLTGKPLKEPGGASPTVKDVVVNALITATEGTPTATDKFARYQLARKIAKGGDVDLTPEDLTLVKLVVGQVYGPLVVGQVFEWADK